MSRTLEQIRTMAKRSANSERKPMSILNLNPIAALYVVRDYMQGMESRREFVERVDPDAVEPSPVVDETVAAVSITFDTNHDGSPRRMEKRDGGPFAYTALGTATDPATGKEYAVNVYEDRDGLIECVLYLNGRTIPESHKANVRDAAIEAYRAAFLRHEPVAADPVPVTPSHRPILDSDVEAATHGLGMARKAVGQLESLITHHGKPEMLFASHVITEAARREIERRSPRPEPVAADPTPAESHADTFTLIGRPTLTFRVVRRYDAGGFIPSVVGVSLDGTRQTTARIADCVFSLPEPVLDVRRMSKPELRMIAHDALDGSTDEGERFLTADEYVAAEPIQQVEPIAADPTPVQDVRSMSKLELRAIVQRGLDGWNGDDSSLTEEHFAAAGELERRSMLGESAFEARVEAAGGKDAFDYEVRDPSDGLTGHAYDLLCDQFFGLDDACGGDYDAAWERATSVLASCTPFLRAFDASQQADASVALMAASAHMERVGADGWPNPTAALTRLAQQHCEFAVADWLAKERARRCADTKADARAIAAHWQSIADVFGHLNSKALRG